MKRKTIGVLSSLFAIAIICLFLTSPLATANSLNSTTPQKPPISLNLNLPFNNKLRSIDSDWKAEYLSIMAGKGTSALIYPSIGGLATTPMWFNEATAPNYLVDAFVIAAAQDGWYEYWNRPLWETPDGMYMYLYLILVF